MTAQTSFGQPPVSGRTPHPPHSRISLRTSPSTASRCLVVMAVTGALDCLGGAEREVHLVFSVVQLNEEGDESLGFRASAGGVCHRHGVEEHRLVLGRD